MDATNPGDGGLRGVVVEEDVWFSVHELGRACDAGGEQLGALVDEGVLTPGSGADAESWRFPGGALRRARTALRLTRELELDLAAVTLVLDLLDEIHALEARLLRVAAAAPSGPPQR